MCTAIPDVLRLFNKLIQTGFKVFLVTGRDEETLGQVTVENLLNEGYFGYERLILRYNNLMKLIKYGVLLYKELVIVNCGYTDRSAAYKGQGAIAYKSAMRKQLTEEGYRIWGNTGDQWSDLQGEYIGNRTFKLPNPMYFVP